MNCAKAMAIVLLGAMSAGAGAKRPVKEVAGKKVVIGSPISTDPAVELQQVRFYPCKLKDTDQPCTVVVGYLVSHLPHHNFVVEIEFELLRYKPGNSYTHAQGTITVKVIQPARGKPRKFVAVGPSWFGLAADGSPGSPATGEEARYLTKITHRPFKPEKDGFWNEEGQKPK